jgi:arabinogalactan oligomer / maltooligosaccharide transport system substrate-binding protein
MKKIGVFSLFLVIMLALAACSSKGAEGEKGAKAAKGDVEVEVKSASFVLLGDQGESIDPENERNPLAVTLKVKNTSDSALNVSTHSNIKVYDGDDQLTVEPAFNSSLGFEASTSDEIGAGKAKDVTFIFNAEKEKEYEISVTPTNFASIEDKEEVLITIDTAEYAESFDNLNNPAKALAAYIETIYMDKENVDYEKLVAADKQALQEEALTAFKEVLESKFYSIDISKEDAAKQYAIYKTALAQKAEVNTATVVHANGMAEVKLDYVSLPLTSMYDKISDYQDEYHENAEKYDNEKSDEYAFSKLDIIFNSLETKNGSRDYTIKMIEKDGKWTIDSDHYGSNEILNIFVEGL